MANLLDEASILLTPTAYNNGSMLAVKPENGDGDMTFSRNSAATRVNAQGLVENVQILSSNLVSNGDFSQEGAEEVSNGSFSQEGAEQVTAFTNGTTYPFSTFTSLDNNITSAIINSNFAGCVSNSISVTSSQTYKVSFNYTKNSGDDLRVVFSSSVSGAGSQTSNSELVSTSGSITLYLTISSSGTSYLQLGTSSGSASIDFSITNISVKEVGQDWDFVSGATVGDDKAIISGDGSVAGLIEQTSVFSSGKTYKITLDAVINSGGGLNVKHGIGFADNIGSMITTGSYTFYYTAPSTKSLVIARKTGGVAYDSTITNISVKEVGQDWALGTGWSIGEGKAERLVATSSSDLVQASVFPNLTSTFRISFDVESSVGSVRARLGQTNLNYVGQGTHTFYAIPSGNDQLKFQADSSFNGSITNISVIEITDDTNLPRINYEGFSYQDSLGSEKIVNGNFSNGLSAWTNNSSWWSIVNGEAYHPASTSMKPLSQSVSTEVGKEYKISVNVNIISGTPQVFWDKVSGQESQSLSQGLNEIIVTTFKTNSVIYFGRVPSINTEFYIDNVSVKEYLGQEVVPNSGCGSWLLEPQSTNLIPYSESLTQWANILYTLVESNSTISPDGSVNADKLVAGATNGLQLRIAPLSLTSGNTYTFSTYVKNSGGNYVILYMNDSSSQGIKVDLVNETFVIMGSSTNHFIKNFGNGWYQIGFTRAIDANVSGLNAVPSLDGNNVSFLGDGVNGVYVWGTQVEEQSYATSYIPTSGASSTRLADIATNSGNASLINSEEGTLYVETQALIDSGSTRYLSLTDGTSSNRMSIVFGSSSNQIRFLVYNGVVQSDIQTFSYSQTDINKIAFRYAQNNFSLWVNGVKVGENLSGDVFALNTLSFDLGNNSLKWIGKTKALAVYKTALTDAQLTALTTI